MLAALCCRRAPSNIPPSRSGSSCRRAPGGVADIVGRTFAQKLTEAGKAAVVENRTGGGGVIAADFVAKSPPDGYTVYIGFHGTQAILPHLAEAAVRPAARISRRSPIAVKSANILVVHPSVPAQDAEGTGRLRQGQSRQAHLRLAGQRQLRPHRRRAVQADRRHRHRARALSRRRAGGAGPRRRPRLDDVRHPAARAARRCRPARCARSRSRRRKRQCRCSRRADHGGSRLSAARRRPVVRLLRAGRHAACRSSTGSTRRPRRRSPRPTCASASPQQGLHAAARHAGGDGRLRRGGVEALGRCHQARPTSARSDDRRQRPDDSGQRVRPPTRS